MAKAYSGTLDMDIPDSYLLAERSIVRDSEIAFHLRGAEPVEGAYELDGTAAKTCSGVFGSPQLPVHYGTWAGNYTAQIIISKIVEGKRGCQVVGSWIQEDRSWEFSGQLQPYRPKFAF